MGLTAAEAAEILGVTELSVHRLVHQGTLRKARKHERAGLDLNDVEMLALDRWRRPGHPHWANRQEAAQILGVSPNRVNQLLDTGRIPGIRHRGRWFFRRQQLEVIANAREVRKSAQAGPLG